MTSCRQTENQSRADLLNDEQPASCRVKMAGLAQTRLFPLVEPQQLEAVDPQRFSAVTFTRVS